MKAGLGIELHHRTALPEALRVLVAEYPRDLWESHERFDGLVKFWLERHLLFRRLLETLRSDAEAAVDGTMSNEIYKPRLAKLGSMLVNELHTHHHIEDHQYFPILQKLDSRVSHGFDILDADHHALDDHLRDLTTQANIVISGDNLEYGESIQPLAKLLSDFERFLNRHLIDEEELVVPTILKYGI